jgi:signal transduction histidine kinase
VSNVHEPSPDQYNPPLTRQAHVWRTSVALLVSGLFWSSAGPAQWQEARSLFWLDASLGVVALALSFFRRRWPLTVAVVTNVAGAFSVTATGPHVLAAVSLATRRVLWQIGLIGLLGLGASIVIPTIEPNPNDFPWWFTVSMGAASMVAMLVCGMYIGSRRELLWTLRDRAERAEAEQEFRVEQGQANERARIAREMHDVLAHRISLIAMHAGALVYRTNLPANEIHATAELIQAKSHEALSDLRQVLGLLRDPEMSGLPERPLPTYRDLSALVLEAEDSGMRIQYDDRVLDAAEMPDQVGRTTYRIVQEALTNVRKHAPGVTVMVRLTGSAADGVSIRVRNPARSVAAVGGINTPGAGLGLVGLGERAKLAGGRLTTERNAGSFELTGWLPWKA